MDPLTPLADQEFKAQTQALVAAWEENLSRAEPVRQRIFHDYQLLYDARSRLVRWIKREDLEPAERTELRALEQQSSSCLAFASLAPEKVASLRRLLFSDRSRGCRSTVSPLERELLENLAERALER